MYLATECIEKGSLMVLSRKVFSVKGIDLGTVWKSERLLGK